MVYSYTGGKSADELRLQIEMSRMRRGYYNNPYAQKNNAATQPVAVSSDGTIKGSVSTIQAQDEPIVDTHGYETLEKYEEFIGNNKCTDDKDDGKVGFWNATGNVLEGALKSINPLNILKNLTCNEEGKFSFGKTLTNVAIGVGVAALTTAFPVAGGAVIAGLGAMGAVSGATKALDNVQTALSAETDAQAKAAWENVGSGSVETAISAGVASAGVTKVLGAIQNSKAVSSLSSLANTAKTAKQGGFRGVLQFVEENIKNAGAKAKSGFGKFFNTKTANGGNGFSQKAINFIDDIASWITNHFNKGAVVRSNKVKPLNVPMLNSPTQQLSLPAGSADFILVGNPYSGTANIVSQASSATKALTTTGVNALAPIGVNTLTNVRNIPFGAVTNANAINPADILKAELLLSEIV